MHIKTLQHITKSRLLKNYIPLKTSPLSSKPLRK